MMAMYADRFRNHQREQLAMPAERQGQRMVIVCETLIEQLRRDI